MGRTSGGSSDDLAKIMEASRLLASVDPQSALAAWSHAQSAYINRILHDARPCDVDEPPRPVA
jgi:hypothetical protein